MDPKLADVFFNGRPSTEPPPPKEVYRLLRLEFIKAAMAGYAANSAEWIKNASTPDTAKLAIQLADVTLAAAGEKGP